MTTAEIRDAAKDARSYAEQIAISRPSNIEGVTAHQVMAIWALVETLADVRDALVGLAAKE